MDARVEQDEPGVALVEVHARALGQRIAAAIEDLVRRGHSDPLGPGSSGGIWPVL